MAFPGSVRVTYPKELRAKAKEFKFGLFCLDLPGVTFSGPVKPEDCEFFNGLLKQVTEYRNGKNLAAANKAADRPPPLEQKLDRQQKKEAQSLFDAWGEFKDELSEAADNLNKAETSLRALGIDPKNPPKWLK